MAKEPHASQTPPAPQAAPKAALAPAASPFESLRREIDRLFEAMSPGEWRWPSLGASGLERLAQRLPDWTLAPAMDMVESDTGFTLTAELPGLEDKDVEVKVAGGMLTIKGEKSEQKDQTEGDYHMSERRYGRFQRSFRVPEGVDADRIDAHLDKGVLTVTLPKSERARAEEKKIEIRKG